MAVGLRTAVVRASLLEELATDAADFADLARVLRLDLRAVVETLTADVVSTPAELVAHLRERAEDEARLARVRELGAGVSEQLAVGDNPAVSTEHDAAATTAPSWMSWEWGGSRWLGAVDACARGRARPPKRRPNARQRPWPRHERHFTTGSTRASTRPRETTEIDNSRRPPDTPDARESYREVTTMRTNTLWRRWLAAAMVAGLVVTGPGVSFAGSTSSSVDDRLRALEAELEQLKRERAQQAEEPPVGESQVKNIVDETLKKQKVLAGWQGRLLPAVAKRRLQVQAARLYAGRRAFLPVVRRRHRERQLLPAPRPADFEGTRVQVVRVPHHARLRRGYRRCCRTPTSTSTTPPYASLRAGKFKEPYSLERLQSGTELLFIERSLAQNIAPNRDVGVQLFGDVGDGIFQYQLGIFNGVARTAARATSDLNSDKDFAGRVFVAPAQGRGVAAVEKLGFGLAGTYGNRTDDNGAVNFRTAGRSSFYRYANNTVAGKGIQWRIAPQAYWFWGPFGFMGEYYKSESRIKGTVGTGDDAQIAERRTRIPTAGSRKPRGC